MGGLITKEDKVAADKEYARQRNYELWINSRTFKSIRKMLSFLTNFSAFEFNMAGFPDNYDTLVYSILKLKAARAISLECVDISSESFKKLDKLLAKQRETRIIKLSFERKLKEGTSQDLTPLCQTISQKTQLLNLTLGNWAKNDPLTISGKVLGDVLKNTHIRYLTLQRIEIKQFDQFSKSLSGNKTLSVLWMQSVPGYNMNEVRSVYSSFIGSAKIKKIEMVDKNSKQFIAWKEYAKILASSLKIKEIKIIGDDATSQGAVPDLLESFSKCRSLRSVALTHFQKSPLFQNTILLEKLCLNALIENLDLSGNSLDSPKLVEGIVKFVQKSPNLRNLNLSYMLLNKDETRPSCSTIILALCNNLSLESLNLSCNLFKQGEEKAIVQLVSTNSKLHEIILHSCDLSDQFLCSFFESLKKNTSLLTIDLKDQDRKVKVYSQAGKAIAECLATNRSLKVLGLKGNDFTDEGIVAIFNEIINNDCLKQFNVTCLSEDEKVVDSVGVAFSANKALEKFSFELKLCLECSSFFQSAKENRMLTAIDIQTPIFSVASLTLLGKGIEENHVLKILKLVGAFEEEGANPLSAGLAKNQGIQYLSLTSSQINRTESISFMEFLKTNTTLEYLQLYFQVLDLQDSDITALLGILYKNTTLKFLGFSHGQLTSHGLRELKQLKLKNIWLKLDIF